MPLSEFPSPLDDATGDERPEIRVTPPGPQSKSATLRLERVECPAFGGRREARSATAGVETAPIVLASGRGSNLHDVDGNRYVDLAAGFGAALLGHGATAVARALEAQSERLVQGLGDVYAAEAKVGLLERLAALHPGEKPRVLLGQSGSDAVTAALKTAMLATGKPGVVAFEGAYHGLGYAPLAACGLRESYRAPFAAQLNTHVTFAPYPAAQAELDASLQAVEAACRAGDVGAVLVEPVLGRGGCVVPPPGFVTALCEVAHRHGALVIADEIWTGLGRSGAMVKSVADGAPVDVVCLGKGLGGGLPLSACIASEAIMQAWAGDKEVVHTSTHSGAPLACATAIATLDSLRFRQLVTRSAEVGAVALRALAAELAGAPGFVAARGVGLMIGVELRDAATALRVTRGLLEEGWIVLGGGRHGEVITITPALTIQEDLLLAFPGVLRAVLEHRGAVPPTVPRDRTV